MKELQFVAAHEASWDLWDRWLGLLGGSLEKKPGSGKSRRGKRELDAIPAHELPTRYRALCRDLSLAHERNYSGGLVDRLQLRVLLAHQLLYGAKSGVAAAALAFLSFGLPLAVRREYRCVAAAALLFFVPLIAVLFVVLAYPDAVYLFLPAEDVNQFSTMYGAGFGKGAHAFGGDVNFLRYTAYIRNNVTIDFQCFATGLSFGVGSVFYIIYNALHIGSIAGYLSQSGAGTHFWGFVSGHSAFELTGIVLSGAAGLKLGIALVAPSQKTRHAALLENARAAAPLIFGAALFTFFAAAIEAFWSPLTSVPFAIKVGVGVTLWVAVWSYLLLMRAPRTPLARARR